MLPARPGPGGHFRPGRRLKSGRFRRGRRAVVLKEKNERYDQLWLVYLALIRPQGQIQNRRPLSYPLHLRQSGLGAEP